jgi:hypothetical protein
MAKISGGPESLPFEVSETLRNIRDVKDTCDLDQYPLIFMMNQVYQPLIVKYVAKNPFFEFTALENIESDVYKQKGLLMDLKDYFQFDENLGEYDLIERIFFKLWEAESFVREIKVNHVTRVYGVNFETKLIDTGKKWSFLATDYLGNYLISLVNTDLNDHSPQSAPVFDKPRITITVCYEPSFSFHSIAEKVPVTGYFLKSCSCGLVDLKKAVEETRLFF